MNWIKREDREPEGRDIIILYIPTRKPQVTTAAGDWRMLCLPYTHWMPLPEGPTDSATESPK